MEIPHMTTPTNHIQLNPLASFMRQPKIYIKLPSNGQYWPADSLKMSDTGELAVYSMTAKDELSLKIPDALMNGQAVVDVIQHCVPSIINAWNTPMIDMDAILIAIRMATYGPDMVTPLKFGEDIEMSYKLDLRTVLDSLMQQITWESVVSINEELTVFVRPLTYKQSTAAALKTFETQKIMQLVNDQALSEDEKLEQFKESFKKLTDVTVGIVADSIYKVESSQGSTDQPEFIGEFINNIDTEMFNKINDHLVNLQKSNTVKPMVVNVTEEMKLIGITGDTVEVPLIFDASTFFA